jgi:hypothetical protein
MQKKSNLLLIAFIISAGMLMSFQETDHATIIQNLITEEINRRVEEYRITRIKKCKEKILEAADLRADSIIIARSRELKILQDSISRPFAPDRPTPPKLLEPLDSSLPAPILFNKKDTLKE